MAATSTSFTGDNAIKIHGLGVPNAYCGDYPNIKLSFTIIFDRTGANNNQQIVWHTEGMGNWIHPTSGTYGYHLFAYIEINDTGRHAVLTKNNTIGSSWWNHTTLSDTGEQSFDTTSNQAVMKVWVKSKDSCMHSGQFCYRNGDYTLLYAITVDLPTYETFYTVHYEANGGSGAPDNQTKSSNSALQLSGTVPTKTLSVQYVGVTTTTYPQTFNSWYCSADGQYYSPSSWYGVNSNCTMTAQWGVAAFTPPALPDSSYVVTYHYNGGTGSPATTTLARTKLGYNTSSSAATPTYAVGVSYTTSTNLVLYPIYKNPTLVFTSLPKPTKAGYAFTGWYLDSALTNQVTSNIVISANTDLYAGWRAVPLHQFTSTGAWRDIPPKVYQFKNNNSWVKDRPVYRFDGTRWINISE